jgi:uncharacterized protein YceK
MKSTRDTMPKLYLSLSLTLLISLLSGCASIVESQLEDYRMPTDVPSASSLTETSETELALSIPPADCPVTTSENVSFQAPEPYSPSAPWEGFFWFGSEELWTALQTNGVWTGLPHNPEGYSQKIPWWREGYIWNEEPEPALVVTGERLDAKVPPLNASKANGAYADDMGSAMMMGVDFPTLGCWKITGKYKDAELSFVVWVAP